MEVIKLVSYYEEVTEIGCVWQQSAEEDSCV
jgi:hypothetical protein